MVGLACIASLVVLLRFVSVTVCYHAGSMGWLLQPVARPVQSG